MCKGLWLIAGLVSQGCGRKDRSDVGGRVVGLRVCRGRWVCQGSAAIVCQRMGWGWCRAWPIEDSSVRGLVCAGGC